MSCHVKVDSLAVSIVGTVINTPNVTLACGGRQVTVTLLLPRQVNVSLPSSPRVIKRVMLKAVCKSKGGTKNKTDPKMFFETLIQLRFAPLRT